MDNIDQIEEQLGEVANKLIEIAEEFNKLEIQHKELYSKFSAFAKATLSNLDKETAQKIFKEYQKNCFKPKE
jgi:hypothetical protein